MIDTDRPFFTDRYGRREAVDAKRLGKPPWTARHRALHCDLNGKLQCRCPGAGDTQSCALPVTQEDGLCDQCRSYCVCIDSNGERQLIANVEFFR